METFISELRNGLRIATTPIAEAQSASISLFVGTGSRYESKRINGISHYLEHMLFKGTAKRPKAEMIAEAIEGAGGRSNAFTSYELTCYVAKVPFDKLGIALDVTVDMVNDSLLDLAEVERERSVIKEEIKREKDNPASWVWELLSEVIYGDQPLGWNVAGTEEIVSGITRQDLADYVGTWYVPNNMVLSIAGRVSHEEIVNTAGKLFDERKRVSLGGFAPVSEKKDGPAVQVETRSNAQSNLTIGLTALHRLDPDRFILTLLNNLLGRGMSSRLFREVRERRGLAYSVGSSTSRFHDTGLMVAHAGVDPTKVVEAAKVIIAEMEKLTVEAVGAEELEKAKDFTIGNFRLDLEDSMSVSRYVGTSLLSTGELEDIDDTVSKFRAVQPEDILRVAARLIDRKKMSMAVTGPNDVTAELLAELQG
ncbi:MAG: insulinase family protein [Dehalococcoidia bacterium]|nr:insulinase family protein [Dehalococcoidia bacterium]